MGWLLGCFKCRQRHRAGSSINLTTNCKDGTGVSASAGFLSTYSAQSKGSQFNDGNSNTHTERFEEERVLTEQGNELERNSSAIFKTERRCRSARRHSSEQSLQVEKLEEEINNLNRKLVEEASQATSLTNEVRHLRDCSTLLDSPNAFKKALDALEKASEKGQVEESQPLLYLQSLLSKIEFSEAVVEPSSEERDEGAPKGSKAHLKECLDPSLMTKKEQNTSENIHGTATLMELDQSQGRMISNTVTISRVVEEALGLEQKDGQSVCNSRRECSFDEVNIDVKQPQLISVTKRRRSATTLSFSGFLLMEDATEERTNSEQVAIEHISSTEFSASKIIETTDLSNENLVESSKSLFAFATDSSQSPSISTEHSLFENVSKKFSFPSSDSEAEPSAEKPDANASIFDLHYRSPRCLWSPQDDNVCELLRVSSSLSIEQSQVDTEENSYNGFSDALSLSSTSSSSKTNCISAKFLDSEGSDQGHGTHASSSKVLLQQMHIPSVEDKGSSKQSVNSHAIVRASSTPQQEDINEAMTRNLCRMDCCSSADVQSEGWPRSMDCSVYSCQRSVTSVDSSEGGIAQVTGLEAKHVCTSSVSKGQMSIEGLERTNQGESILSEEVKLLCTNEAALNQTKILDQSSTKEEATPQKTSHLASPSLVQAEFSMLGGETSMELSTPGTTSVWSPHTEASPPAVHTFSPLPHLGGSRKKIPSDGPSQTPLTPIPVNSILSLSKDSPNKPQCTPLRTPLASLSQPETPNSLHCQGSPASLSEDRPILGTVAAHWNHSSSSSTQKKWWDGKGIPNSTNKYKEDQKVSWHATPFEVRLERALAKQGRVFQKKLFTGAVATEMEVSI
eukprot:c36595_g1_i1 orf=239-2791(-)